jgi:predicted ArsR family transcriptional regulator
LVVGILTSIFMETSFPNKRFWGTTRGRIVALLRRASRTVNELAETLELTDNAVRAHIATLERDGLVEQVGTRRGTARKPNHAYDLTPEAAERLFPKAYAPVLQETLTVLREWLPAAEREALLREVGRRLAAPHTTGLDALSRQERLDRTVTLLAELGGQAESGPAATDGPVPIEGRSCPLSGVVAAGYPEVCVVAEALVASLMGEPASERCDRDGAAPRCRFLVGREAYGPDR